jgi:hypothetical protein
MNEFDKLELSTETLRDLSSDELAAVAGGAADTTATCRCPTIPVVDCTTPFIQHTLVTCHCP